MKRTIPLLITALTGFVLIFSQFIPATQTWGETTAVWFDILAAIAFVLGGGNLLRMHLQKISDRAAGWGYSAIVLLAFIVTLWVGLGKVGSSPAPDQEAFGEVFAELPLAEFPESEVASVEGTLPEGERLEIPLAVRPQLSSADGQLRFRGWMSGQQMGSLMAVDDTLEWRCTVERLFAAAQPPEELGGAVGYYAEHQALSYAGVMSDEHRTVLLGMNDSPSWTRAVNELYEKSRRAVTVTASIVPATFSVPESMQNVLKYDADAETLTWIGPMSPGQQAALQGQFPLAKPLSDEQRQEVLTELERRGEPLNDDQREEFAEVFRGGWTVERLTELLNEAGTASPVPKTYCEMLAEREAGATEIIATKPGGENITLNDAQVSLLEEFANDADATIDQLIPQLEAAGPFPARMQTALRGFQGINPTIGERNRALYYALLKAGPLTTDQRRFLLEPYREQFHWRATVAELFAAAHIPKYPWSGSYREDGTPFWWLYEFVFKPLTATMFAMLAFYVASAAFRAFRAKNLEAILLLGTAFIVLLGRTAAGVLLTDWVPDSLAGLKIENLTMYIMQVFATAGNRAIMIGVALGIAATSLRVLLGIDRSYLGSGEE